MKMKLILASSSSRRAELLRDAGIAFEVNAPHVDEARHPDETAEKMVARLAEAKARAAAESAGEGKPAIIIGADTAVELDGEIFGKPRDAADAREMLSYLSGRTHFVLTGIFVLRLPDGATRSAVERTAVTFAPLDPNEIEAYVTSGEPFDKAGGGGHSRRAWRLHSRLRGGFFHVLGVA